MPMSVEKSQNLRPLDKKVANFTYRELTGLDTVVLFQNILTAVFAKASYNFTTTLFLYYF